MDEIRTFKSIPKLSQIIGSIKDITIDGTFGNLQSSRKYRNNTNNHKVEIIQCYEPKDEVVPVTSKNSFAKYESSIPFADISEIIGCNVGNISKESDEGERKINSTLFKTGSISSLKVSSLTEQWPSSEYIQSVRCKVRTQSTGDENRCQLQPNVTMDGCNLDPFLRVTDSDRPISIDSDKSALTSCLSKCDISSKVSATNIMKQMDFSDMTVVDSLQHFIKKIPVIGESQERDRILTYFTNRYMECNPRSFKNTDACHTLVCALMLLNTDIHGQVSKKRMTSKEFVDNILTNYPENDYKETDLINVYNFIRKTELKNEEASDSSNTLRRKITKLLSKSIRPSQEISYTNIDANLLNEHHFISGNIMRKCVKRSFGKKPALGHRGWKLQFASLIGLQLLLFKTNLNKNDGRLNHEDHNDDRVSLSDSNISSELLQNDTSSLSFSVNNTTKSICSKIPSSCSRDNIQISVDDVDSCIKIHHALACVVEKLRHKNVFSLRLADQAEYFFKVKSDQLHTWVNNINYAAAILSAPPIVGAGHSGLYKPLLPGYLTDLTKMKQIESHELQIRQYKESLKKLQLLTNKTRILNEPHIQFCKYEVSRFETYLRLLRSQSIEEAGDDQRYPCMEGTPMLPSSSEDMFQSPLSVFNTYHNAGDTFCHDLTTLRRRPPKVPSVSSPLCTFTNSSTSNMHDPSSVIQVSSTSDSLHNCYIPPRRSPVLYSPQTGLHLQFVRSSALRPLPSFSRFLDPSLNSFEKSPRILSSLTKARIHPQSSCISYHSPDIPDTKLPSYSPISRHAAT